MTGAVPPPWQIGGPGGLSGLLVDGGAPASLRHGGLELVQHAASAFEPGLLQVWLRNRTTGRCTPLIGAGSLSAVVPRPDGAVLTGTDEGLSWTVTLALHASRPAWAWHVEVRHDAAPSGPEPSGPEPSGPASSGPASSGPEQGAVDVDLVHAHDVALAAPGMLRANELYVSQYLDLTPLRAEGGTALAVRQNLAQDGRNPWCVLAADVPVVAWATDALDVHGVDGRDPHGRPGPGAGDLPSRRRQHEHTLATLQTEVRRLNPGEALRVTFAGLVLDDHPGATGDGDLAHVEEALDAARGTVPWASGPGASTSSATASEGTSGAARPAPSGVYDRGRTASTRPLSAAELAGRWPGPWRAVERDGTGDVLSFFGADDVHVVTRTKELTVLRPHGTILRTGATAVPDPASLTTTAWMTGSPVSFLTRGHVATGRVLTTVRGYLGLHRAYGLRVLVADEAPAEGGDGWRLLDLPSAFAMTLDGAHWVHALDGGSGGSGGSGGPRPDVVEVRTLAPPQDHRVDLEVSVTGAPRRVLLALHLAGAHEPLPGGGPTSVEHVAGGVEVRLGSAGDDGGSPRVLHVRTDAALTTGDDSPLFDDGRSRDPGVVTLAAEVRTDAPLVLSLRVGHADADAEADADAVADAGADTGAVADTGEGPRAPGPDGAGWWPAMTAVRVEGPEAAEALAVSLPWLARDAVVHHLAPRGLEQFTGGAWGTRDVTQGPLELLLALDRLDDARALLLSVFAAQNRDGSWPQAFGFLPGDEHFRHEPPHGDVVHWPVLALGRYLEASGDATVLDELVPWYTPDDADGPTSSLVGHVLQALGCARSGYLPGTHLVAYGHGDWNDSLQPADPTMARTMTSTWTVTLHHQALRTLADGLERAGVVEHVDHLRAEAAVVAADLRRHLVVDDELVGYARFDSQAAHRPARVAQVLVHPRDDATGLHHGSLQIIHALGDDLLDPAQAAHHVDLVRRHLTGVDGVRLFDRPPGYHGGVTHHFQRAETATFVGREIGLMYVHAHLRWCEAMARWGDAEALWSGVRQVLAPCALEVPGARRRQANTYASSSDAAALDRAEFAARYADVLDGSIGLEGGWRIYSSGPGVLLRVLTHSLLGVRRRGDEVEIDPVLPTVLDGLGAQVPLAGGALRLRYRVGPRGHGPSAVRLGGADLTGVATANPYRPGGVRLPLDLLAGALRAGAAGTAGAEAPELEVVLP